MNRKKIHIDNIEEFKLEYYNNPNSFLCEKYHCCGETLTKFIKENNIKLKYQHQITENDTFFKDINTEEKAYYLGFICADGSINNKKSKLSITINTKDIEILYKFKDLLKTTTPITSRIYVDKRTKKNINTTSFQLYSKRIVNDLKLLMINENKSKQLNLPKINDELIRFFIRGLFDGDGHIGKKQIDLISTNECLDDIIFYLTKNNINVLKNILSINKKKNVFKLFIGKDRMKFLNLIYENSQIHLTRKYDAHLKAIEIYNNEIVCKSKQHKILLLEHNIVFDSKKDCAKYLKLNYTFFLAKIKRGDFDNKIKILEKCLVKKKRNGEIIKTII